MAITAPRPTLPETGFVRLPTIIGDPKADPPIPAIIPVSKSTWWAGVPPPVANGPTFLNLTDPPEVAEVEIYEGEFTGFGNNIGEVRNAERIACRSQQ